ncbi:MAG: ribosomal protein L7/L12 [Chthoniobacteraceae bacterium]
MPDPLSPQQLAAIRAALAAGNKIEAIKLLREATGLGLAEAKEAVEKMERDPGATAIPAQAGTSATVPPAVRAALMSGNKIEAIRLYREAMGGGLKEAKEAVERIAQSDPSLPPNVRTKGCLGLVIGCAAPIAALAIWRLVT